MGINNRISRICLIPNVSGVGGMVTFRGKLVKGLAERGIGVSYDLEDTPYEAILVIGGTRDLVGLWRAKRRGVRVVQRLDGMNWIHRKKRTGWRHYLRAEYGNFILSLIRSRLADQIVYQSEFSHQWWERVYRKSYIPWDVVHNGVDLELYNPNGSSNLPGNQVRILLVEGTIGSGYELGLEIAIHMGERLNASYRRNVEVMVVGRTSEGLQREWKDKTDIKVTFTGEVPVDRIPEMDRSAHVLYAADLNPACPNSVIEALACGLPVAAYDTGALSEIITGGSGQVVPYGGDPWKLEPPDIEGLAKAVNVILDDQARYRIDARQRAEDAFGLDQMVEGYLNALILP
jgi:glycosyltransferase involved in cell wall biosynthesis